MQKRKTLRGAIKQAIHEQGRYIPIKVWSVEVEPEGLGDGLYITIRVSARKRIGKKPKIKTS